MNKPKDDLTKEYVDGMLVYDPETGSLTWKWFRGRKIRGAEAGFVNNRGYRLST